MPNEKFSLKCMWNQLVGFLWASVQVGIVVSVDDFYLDRIESWPILAGGMTGADIGVGWVDANATAHFQVWAESVLTDEYAFSC